MNDPLEPMSKATGFGQPDASPLTILFRFAENVTTVGDRCRI
jgi:hypothetical protein